MNELEFIQIKKIIEWVLFGETNFNKLTNGPNKLKLIRRFFMAYKNDNNLSQGKVINEVYLLLEKANVFKNYDIGVGVKLSTYIIGYLYNLIKDSIK